MNAPARTGNGIAVALPHGPGRVGQGTAIEQSRAAAEVYASVLAAKQSPRDELRAQDSMGQVCGMAALAERAFFRFNRGGSPVTGPTVHLARELARCWGNIHYGVSELRRDDEAGQSEMQAFAWDLETNARSAHIFIVPHKRDKKGGPEALTDMRDIYESNANNGARRVREAIFAVLPLWFVEQAQEMCRHTLAQGGGKPLPQRIADAIRLFGEIGVRKEQLEEKLGLPSPRWGDPDVATLRVTYQSIQRGEVTKADEFPPSSTVTVRDITAATALAEPEPAGRAVRKPTQKKLIAVNAWFSERKITDADRISYVAALAQRPDLQSTKELSDDEATAVLTHLDRFGQTEDPVTELQEYAAEWHGRHDQVADDAVRESAEDES